MKPVDLTHILKLVTPSHKDMVREGMTATGRKRLAELHQSLALTREYLSGSVNSYRRALAHVERMIEDVDHAMREARGRFQA